MTLDGALSEFIHRRHGFEADLTHFAITGLCADCASAVVGMRDSWIASTPYPIGTMMIR